MADVTITIDADDQSQAGFAQVFDDLKRLEDRIEALADTEKRAARESESEVERSEREKKAARESANRDQITFIKNLRRQEAREAKEAAQAAVKAVRDAQAMERSILADRKREFNRILRETTIISEQAAREIANDFSDIEGSLNKAITAYRRGQREAEKFYKEQQQAAMETVAIAKRSRRSFSELFHNISNGIFIFQELRFAVNSVLGGIIDVTARTQTMRATLRVTETDVRGVTEELLDLNRTLLGIEIDTLIGGFTRFRVAGASIEESKTALSAVAKAVAELGKSTEVTERVVEQLTQSYAQNIADAQDLKTLFRELPQLMGAATSALNFQVQGWRDFGAAAKASGVDVREAWRLTLAELNRTSLGGDRNTFAAQSEIFRENLNDLRRAIGQELVPAITQGVRAINEWLRNGGIETLSGGFSSLARSIVPATVGIGAFFGVRGLRGGIPHVRNAIDRIREMQSTFREFNSGISSAVFNTSRWRDSLLIAERNAADANAQVARSVQLYGQANRTLIANAESASAFNDEMKAVNSRFRNFGSIVKGALIDVGISASIGLIIAAWQDHNRQVKAAERLIQEVQDSYASSLDSILTAVKDLDNINLDNISRELERVLREIADARKQFAELNNPGFFSNINPFDNNAVASQRASLKELIENAELQAEFLRALQSGGANNADAFARIQQDVQSEISSLESTLTERTSLLQELPRIIAEHNERVATQYDTRLNLQRRSLKNESDDLKAFISETQSDLQRLQNLRKRIDAIVTPKPIAPGETPVALIDLDKARADLEDDQDALNSALQKGNIALARTLYQETAQSYAALAALERDYAKQTISDETKRSREIYKINRDLFVNTRDLARETRQSIGNLGEAAQPGIDQLRKGISDLTTSFRDLRSTVAETAASSRTGFGNIISSVRDALIPVQSEELGAELARTQQIAPVGREFLDHAKAYSEALTRIAEDEKFIALQRQQFAVDPLQEIGRGPDVSESSDIRERERRLAFESNQFVLGLVRNRFREEMQAAREHSSGLLDIVQNRYKTLTNLALSFAFDREQSFKETAVEFVKQSAIIIAQSVVEHQIRMAQIRRETAELNKLAAARNAALGEVLSAGGSSVVSSILGFVPGGSVAAPIVNALLQIGPNEAREIGEYQGSLTKQGRN